MESPEQIFREFLRERGPRHTTERSAILRAVQKFGRPFEAEELLPELREAEYRVSKATIYRTIKHLLDAASCCSRCISGAASWCLLRFHQSGGCARSSG